MFKLRTNNVPVIIGALGTIKKGSDQKLQLLPGHPSAMELQKVTLMSTVHTPFVKCSVNNFDLLLRSGLNRRPPPNN
jgi:hypothetical protein